MNNDKIEPFVKWAGGKRQLMNRLNLVLPETYNTLIEPFVGGGSFFIEQKNNSNIINDINNELMVTYEVIKREREREFSKLLNEHQKNNSQEYFLKIRSLDPKTLSNEEIAARFIYLNKAGFNGMYRVNKSGYFNVPFGKKEKLKIYDKDNIRNLSSFLKTTKIFSEDYKKIIKMAKSNDLIFVDPPYDKINPNTFTSYDKNDFGEKEQIELSEELKKIDKKGVKFILTNHNTKLINYLYKDFNKIIVPVNRNINSNPEKRGIGHEEVIIFNYEIDDQKLKELKFENFLIKMKPTNKKLDKLVDWEKVIRNVKTNKLELNILNTLISNSEKEFDNSLKQIIEKHNSVFNLLPILIAYREKEKTYEFIDINNNEHSFVIKKENEKYNYDEIKLFLEQSNLKKLFLDKNITDLKDYLTGIEVGLDSNARKNRFGTIYENMIEDLLKSSNIKYKKQLTIKNVVKDGKDKRIDFLIEIKNKKYLLEVNFYNSGGSKLNETATSYIELNNQIKKTKEKYEFIWVTDGNGWKKAKNSLKNAYLNIENVFNFDEFKFFLTNFK